jgi:chromosome segregation ATPase
MGEVPDENVDSLVEWLGDLATIIGEQDHAGRRLRQAAITLASLQSQRERYRLKMVRFDESRDKARAEASRLKDAMKVAQHAAQEVLAQRDDALRGLRAHRERVVDLEAQLDLLTSERDAAVAEAQGLTEQMGYVQ